MKIGELLNKSSEVYARNADALHLQKTATASCDQAHLKGLCDTFDKRFPSLLRVWKHCERRSFGQNGATTAGLLRRSRCAFRFRFSFVAFSKMLVSNVFTAAAAGRPANSRCSAAMR